MKDHVVLGDTICKEEDMTSTLVAIGVPYTGVLSEYPQRSGKTIIWKLYHTTNRQQFLQINGITSYVIKTNIGVPQGSVLGLLIFNINIYMTYPHNKQGSNDARLWTVVPLSITLIKSF